MKGAAGRTWPSSGSDGDFATASPPPVEDGEYREAVLMAAECLNDTCARPDWTIPNALLAKATRRQWYDVIFSLQQSAAKHARRLGVSPADAIQALQAAAQASGDTALIAKGIAVELAMMATPDVDERVAKAVAMLDTGDGSTLSRAGGYIMCGLVYFDLQLPALFEAMNHKALDTLSLPMEPWSEPARRTLVVAAKTNLLAAQRSLACAAYEVGDLNEVAAAAARTPDLDDIRDLVDENWMLKFAVDLDFIAALQGLPAPEGSPTEAEVMRVYPNAREVALVRLADAVRLTAHGRVMDAAERAEAAVPCINQSLGFQGVHRQDALYSLALSIAAAAPPVSQRALRYGRELAKHHWEKRQRSEAAAMAALHAEALALTSQRLSAMAFTDALTGMTNRRGLQEYLAGVQREAPEAQISVLLVDVNKFKYVNDTFGHATGDQVLVKIAEVLRSSVRSSDVAVRTGGDEFVLVLLDVPSQIAERRLNKISQRVCELDWEAVSPGLSVSISVGSATGSVTDVDDLLQRADQNMYDIKRAGGHLR